MFLGSCVANSSMISDDFTQLQAFDIAPDRKNVFQSGIRLGEHYPFPVRLNRQAQVPT